jgi:hypothetical protein
MLDLEDWFGTAATGEATARAAMKKRVRCANDADMIKPWL